MRKVAVIFMILGVVGLWISSAVAEEPQPAAPKGHAYVGSEKCKICHKGENNGNVWEIWEKSSHAQAYKTLVDKGDGSEKKAECLACHTTGFGKPTGYNLEDSANSSHLVNVGCEVCHGPGSDYKTMAIMKDKEKAKAAGLLVPTAETCKACHNEKSPTFKGFNYEESYKKIAHKVPPKKETK